MKVIRQLVLIGFVLVLISCETQTNEPVPKTVVFPPENFSVFKGKLANGKPMVGNVNFGYQDYDQKSSYPWSLMLNVALERSNLFENGLPKNDESTIANKFEDELLAEIKKRAVVHYICHVYGDAFLDVYVYLDEPKKVHEYLQTQINKEGLTRPFRYEIKEDKDWTNVKTYLQKK